MKKIILFIALILCPSIGHSDVVAELNKSRQIIMPPNNNWNLWGFPDASPCVIKTGPAHWFLVAAGKSYLMQGSSIERSVPVKMVLSPSETNAYDGSNTGINGFYVDKEKKELLAFMNNERLVEMRQNHVFNYRFYASCGLAISKDGYNFEKIGPVVTGKPQDPNWQGAAQGNAHPTVVPDHTGKWLYMYYTEHSRENPATGEIRSVITCMARSPIGAGGRPGTWKKYYQGSFDEPGLGGKDTEIADCWAGTVTYVPEMQKYFLLGLRDGICWFWSDDGIHWSEKKELVGEHCLRVPENANEPVYGAMCFVVEKASEKEVNGSLLYGYTPNHTVPMHLVKSSLSFSIEN